MIRPRKQLAPSAPFPGPAGASRLWPRARRQPRAWPSLGRASPSANGRAEHVFVRAPPASGRLARLFGVCPSVCVPAGVDVVVVSAVRFGKPERRRRRRHWLAPP